MRPTRHYDSTFRREAVAMAARGDRSIEEVARSLGMPMSTLWYWYNEDMRKNKKRPTPQSGGGSAETLDEKVARLEKEIAALKKRNDQLEMDRAILKKAAARSTGQRNTS